MSSQETVAVLGAGGTMGFAMARNLARDGFAVRAFNRSRERAEPLAADGAEIFDTAAGAADGATVILTMLSDADAVLDAMTSDAGAFAGESGQDVIWLQMSTIGERGTERCLELAREHEVEFVDAPVSGTKEPAEKGELVILASGPEALRERLQPLFDVMAQRVVWAGEAGAGTKLKVATNSWLLAIVEGAAETLALAEGLGLDPQFVLDAVDGGPLDLPYLKLKGKAMIQREFEPSFKLSLAAKDAGLVMECTDDHGLDLPMLTAIRRRFDEGAAEHGDKDLSATYLLSAPHSKGS